MMNELTINERKKTIEMTKKFASMAKNYGTNEYKNLQEARRDYPNYTVVTRQIKKSNDYIKGLTFDYMENYIKEHEKENDGEHRVLTEFYSLCGRNETGKKFENRVAASYGAIKKWFLKQFPEIEEYKKRNEEILKKVA